MDKLTALNQKDLDAVEWVERNRNIVNPNSIQYKRYYISSHFMKSNNISNAMDVFMWNDLASYVN